VVSKKQQKKRKIQYEDAQQTASQREAAAGGISRCIKVPAGQRIQMFQLKAPISRVDILPYEVGEGNPFAKPGRFHFERTYYTHGGIGASKQAVICPRRTRNERCPICEFRAKMAQDPDVDEKALKALNVKTRQLFNVINVKERDKGVQLWDISTYLFGELLDGKLNNADPEDDYNTFFHLDGLTLKIGAKEQSFNSRKFAKATDIEFKVRGEEYDESILDEVFCLDDLLNHMSYDELNDLFLEAVDADDAASGKSKKKKSRSRVVEDVDDDDDDDDLELDDDDIDDDDEDDDVEEDDEDLDDDDDEVEEDDDIDDDDDDDDDDDVEEDDEEDLDDDDEEEDEDDGPTANQLGMKVTSLVKYNNKCYHIVAIAKDGRSVVLKNCRNSNQMIDDVEVEELHLLTSGKLFDKYGLGKAPATTKRGKTSGKKSSRKSK
jgi:hypothetical protein